MPPMWSARKTPQTAGGREIFYGWWLVGVATAMVTIMALVVFQGMGAYFYVLERQFGWTRTMLSGAFALSRGEGAVLGPIEGYLIDRIGSRQMVLGGYLVMAGGFVLFSQVNSLWQFYLAFMVITLGAGFGGFLPLVTAVNNWFIRRRSLAMAITTSGVNFGGLLVPALAFGLDTYGFRSTTLGIAVFLVAIALVGYRFIRTRPEDVGLLPDGADATTAAGARIAALNDNEPELTAREALRTRAFWILTAANIASGVPLVSMIVHLVPKLTDMGHSLSMAGVVVTTFTLAAIPGVVVAGVLGDRLPKTYLLSVFMVLQGTGIAVLALADNPVWAWVFAPIYGLAFGGRIPLSTAIRGEYFGRKAFATISGISQMPSSLAMMGGPLFAGLLFDLRGSYTIPFATFAAMCFVGAVLILFAKKPRATGAAVATQGTS